MTPSLVYTPDAIEAPYRSTVRITGELTMHVKFLVTYRCGRSLELVNRSTGSPAPGGTKLRSDFESFLKTGKQEEHVFEFEQPAGSGSEHAASCTIKYSVDFREVSSVIEYPLK